MEKYILLASIFLIGSCCYKSDKKQNETHSRLIGSSGNLVSDSSDNTVKTGIPKGEHTPEAYSNFIFVKVDKKRILARKKLIRILTD